MLYHPDTVQTLTATPLGSVRLAASPLGLSGLWFEDQRHAPSAFWQGPTAWPLAPQHALLREAAQQLAQYFDGRRTAFALPLDLSGGTPFQQAVWRALLALRAGSTTSYGALSRVIDRPRAVRALGSAVGRNPLSIVVPCHRVVGADGTLTGYAGGLARKQHLLALEGVQPGVQHGVPPAPSHAPAPAARTASRPRAGLLA